MPRRIFDFDPPDRFVSGTVGEPGNRTFFLQAAKDGRVVSVALEKTQLAVLANRLALLLEALRQRGVDVPEMASGVEDPDPLDEPLVEQFRVGTMTLQWDEEERAIVVEAREVTEDEDEDEEDEDEEEAEAADDDPDGPDLVRVHLSPEATRGFVDRAARVIAAGRPPCPLCGMPLNPQGHICPRRNGSRYVN